MNFKDILKWIIVNLIKPIFMYLLKGYIYRYLKIALVFVIFLVTMFILYKGC